MAVLLGSRYVSFMIRRRLLLGAAAGAMLWPRSARADSLSIRRLDNGLRVAVEVDRRAPRVGVAVAYAVGQRDDPRGYQGLAHMVEHLLFQGSAHVPEDAHFGILEQLGATDQGGFTSLDRTIVYEELPTNAWAVALWLESDRMAYMLRHADERGVAMQREVIRNEWRQRGGNNAIPNRLALATQLIYPEGHPYRMAVPDLGAEGSDLDAIGLSEVAWFFQRHYRPDRAQLAIVGDVEPPAAHALAETYFGTIRSVGAPAPFPRAPASSPEAVGLTEAKMGTVKTQGGRGALVSAWPAAPLGAVDDAALDVIAQHLSRADGPLHEPLVTQGRALSVKARQASGELGSMFFVDVMTELRHSVDRCRELVDTAVQGLRQRGLDEARVRQLVDELALDLLVSAEQPSARAVHLARRLRPLSEEIDRYRRLDVATVNEVARRVLSLDRRVVVRVVPMGKGEDA